jgi:hypothetical protein
VHVACPEGDVSNFERVACVAAVFSVLEVW